MTRLVPLALILTLIWSCNPEEIGPQQLNPGEQPVLAGRQVYVINEGNFGRGNAGISAYSPATSEVNHNIYRHFNEELPLGDVAQDMQRHDDRYYIVLNNSGLIRVIDTTTWKNTGNIEGLQTPRYIAFQGTRAFVTGHFSRNLYIVNLNNLSLEKTLKLKDECEHLINWNGKIVVSGEQYLSVVDPATMMVDTSFTVPTGAERLVVDKDDKLWLLCKGGNGIASLNRYNTHFYSDVNIGFDISNDPHFLNINPAGDELLFIMENGIYSQSVNDTVLDAVEIVSLNQQTNYGFNVDPKTGDLYVADALDYDQASDIYHYDESGQLIKSFKAGVISNGFCFK